jgi:hypothetical protein
MQVGRGSMEGTRLPGLWVACHAVSQGICGAPKHSLHAGLLATYLWHQLWLAACHSLAPLIVLCDVPVPSKFAHVPC